VPNITIFDILKKIKYPATPLDAAVQWKCALPSARQRLWRGVEEDLLLVAKVGRQHLYSPTLNMLAQMLDKQ
jgi:hypothetical protein